MVILLKVVAIWRQCGVNEDNESVGICGSLPGSVVVKTLAHDHEVVSSSPTHVQWRCGVIIDLRHHLEVHLTPAQLRMGTWNISG